jgi:transketolase
LKLAKLYFFKKGTDVSIFATGHLVWEAVEAAQALAKEGLSVELINIHTIKPLDNESILRSVAKTKCVVTAEEHQIAGGMGESIAQLLAINHPVPMEFVAVNDKFGESGKPADLMKKYGLHSSDIIKATHRVLKRK